VSFFTTNKLRCSESLCNFVLILIHHFLILTVKTHKVNGKIFFYFFLIVFVVSLSTTIMG